MKYAVDFEATTEALYNAEGMVRVWAWQARNIDTLQTEAQGNTIKQFIEWTTNRSESADLYFHNLSYDGGFIIDYLLRNNWRVILPGEEPVTRSFDPLISDLGSFYSIKLYAYINNKRRIIITIYDNYKKLPFSIAKIADAFKIPTKKGSIDYHAYRSQNHEMTEEEQEYMDNDTLILASALNSQFKNGLTRMTIASDALNSYKSTLSGVTKAKTDNAFKLRYPELDKVTDDFIRASYKGGFVYLNPKHAGVSLPASVSYDVNSLYPAVMYNSLLPYGTPLKYKGKYKENPTYPLYIQHIRVMFTIKPDHLPTIQSKNNALFAPTDYLLDSKDEIVDLHLTNVDLELFLKHYNVGYIEYIEGLMFTGRRDMFVDYINYWSAVKEKESINKGPLYTIAKLMLNSLYGRFARKTERIRKVPYLDKASDKVRYYYHEEEEGKPLYTAVSSFITAYARKTTISASQDNIDRFIYADTDSLHLVGHDIPDNLEIHNSELGKWAHEGDFGKSKFLRAKTYIKKEQNEELLIVCAGLPQEARAAVTFDNFQLGAVYKGKLSNTTVKGGNLLKSGDYTIRI